MKIYNIRVDMKDIQQQMQMINGKKFVNKIKIYVANLMKTVKNKEPKQCHDAFLL